MNTLRIIVVVMVLAISSGLAAQAPAEQAKPAEAPANLTPAELKDVKLAWLTRENRILKAQQEMQQKIGQAEQEWQQFVQSLQRDGYDLDLNTGVRTPVKKDGRVP